MVQWLRLRAPNTGGPGSIPGQGTRFHMLRLKVCMSQLKRKKKKASGDVVGLPYRGRQTNTPHQTGSRAQIQSPCLKCLRISSSICKPSHRQTTSPRNRFMTFVCKFISSEQMIFLCLFKNKQSPMTDAFIIQTIQRPSGHSSDQHLFPANKRSWQPRASGAPRRPGPEFIF